jgi:hypothetical protein
MAGLPLSESLNSIASVAAKNLWRYMSRIQLSALGFKVAGDDCRNGYAPQPSRTPLLRAFLFRSATLRAITAQTAKTTYSSFGMDYITRNPLHSKRNLKQVTLLSPLRIRKLFSL